MKSIIRHPPLTPDEITRYARHIVIPGVGLEGQQRLKAASVLIVGTGGLGSPIALYLAAAGVGRIGLVDYDLVDVSNLQRQVLHDTPHVGKPKVESARERLLAINPNVQVDCYPVPFTSINAEAISAPYQYLVDGTDNFPTRYLLNDLAVLTKRPYIYGSIYQFEGQVAVFHADQGACYRCLFPQPPPPNSIPSCAMGGVFGVLPGTIGTLQATEVIKLILGVGRSLASQLLLYNALDLSFQTIEIPKNPACPVCGDHPTIHHLIDYDAFCGTPAIGASSTTLPAENILSPSELAKKMQQTNPLCLLDVRLPGEGFIARLPGSINIPLEELPHRMGELDSSIPTVVYCRMGIRSSRAVLLLKDAGFDQVWSLAGGINAWAEEVDPHLPRY